MTVRISCSQITSGYHDTSIVQDINFTAHGGEFLAILGPNGSGKSTLLRLLSGILPPWQGAISINDKPLQQFSVRERAQCMAVVAQKLDTVPPMRVQDMVLLGRYAHLSWLGLYTENDYAAAEKAMQECDVLRFAHRSLQELSGGEMQRVLLARAFAQESPILLLDEPSAALDVARMQEIFAILERKRGQGALIISVMHDINLSALYATRFLGIKKGRLLWDGPAQEVFTSTHLEELYQAPLHIFMHPDIDVPQACPKKFFEK